MVIFFAFETNILFKVGVNVTFIFNENLTHTQKYTVQSIKQNKK